MNSEEINKYIDTKNIDFKNIFDNKIKALEQSVIINYKFENTHELNNPTLVNTL